MQKCKPFFSLLPPPPVAYEYRSFSWTSLKAFSLPSFSWKDEDEEEEDSDDDEDWGSSDSESDSESDEDEGKYTSLASRFLKK